MSKHSRLTLEVKDPQKFRSKAQVEIQLDIYSSAMKKVAKGHSLVKRGSKRKRQCH